MAETEAILAIIPGLETGRMVSVMNFHRAYWTLIATDQRLIVVRERWHVSLPIGTMLLGGILGQMTEQSAPDKSQVLDIECGPITPDELDATLKGYRAITLPWNRSELKIQRGSDNDPWLLTVPSGTIHFRGFRGFSAPLLRITDNQRRKTVVFRNLAGDRGIFNVRKQLPRLLFGSDRAGETVAALADDPPGWRRGIAATVWRKLTSTTMGWLLLIFLAIWVPGIVANNVLQRAGHRELEQRLIQEQMDEHARIADAMAQRLGTIKLDGRPLAGVRVIFNRRFDGSGKSLAAGGRLTSSVTDSNGAFRVGAGDEGLPPGIYTVLVEETESIAQAGSVPEAYTVEFTTPLLLEVIEGRAPSLEFDLR